MNMAVISAVIADFIRIVGIDVNLCIRIIIANRTFFPMPIVVTLENKAMGLH